MFELYIISTLCEMVLCYTAGVFQQAHQHMSVTRCNARVYYLKFPEVLSLSSEKLYLSHLCMMIILCEFE
jgi:hypothetical protein